MKESLDQQLNAHHMRDVGVVYTAQHLVASFSASQWGSVHGFRLQTDSQIADRGSQIVLRGVKRKGISCTALILGCAAFFTTRPQDRKELWARHYTQPDAVEYSQQTHEYYAACDCLLS